ncbi:MAG: MerR family transcriptional regulator [Xanthomonadales bacterium]|nr:MerR family transcriptional regulator [Xanthomonadales bacterium]
MTQDVTSAPGAGEKLYTIGTVSNLTGVAPVTLRAWERRYALIQPVRKESGHRLYTRKNIDQINRIMALTSQGMRISQIDAQMLEPESLQGQEGDSKVNHWRDHLESLIAAIVSYDENRLEDIYNEVLSLYPIELVTQKLLRPLLIELGLRWEDKKGSVAEEHFFAFYLRNKLGARFHHRSRKNQGPRLLVAGLPGEMHEIALLLFALAASEQGYRLISLGANMPFLELAQVAARTASDAIVLSGSVEPGKNLLDEGLTDLVADCKVSVFIGGQASVYACDAINKTGAIALGNDLELGLQRMADQLKFNSKA